MNRIDDTFKALKGKRPVKIIYLTCGYPDFRTTEKTVLALEKVGVDIIELGLPFSDPIADGPVIQKTSWLALQNGYSVRDHFRFIKSLRKKTSIPLAVMTYVNLIARPGYDRTVAMAADAGVDGFIIPDLPLEEAKIFSRLCSALNLVNICFASETTSRERLGKVARLATGFIYAVSQPAVTGRKLELGAEIAKLSRDLRALTRKPVAVGFGISSKKDIARLAKLFDGVIIGSAFLKRMLEDEGKPQRAVKWVGTQL